MIAPALLCLALLCLGLSACGGDPPSAQSLLHDTFHSGGQIERGRLDLSFRLASSGIAALGAPVSVHVSGPFESKGSRELPHFDLSVALQTGMPTEAAAGGVTEAQSAGRTLEAGVVSTGSQFFVEVGGQAFQAPESAVAALAQAYAHASTQPAAKRQSTLASLGIDPSEWLEDPVVVGEQSIEGVETYHVRARLDVSRLLADVAKLVGPTAALSHLGGAAKPGGVGALLALLEPAGAASLTHAVKKAQIDVFTGKSDHLLRLLTLSVSLAPGASERTSLDGLQSATLAAHLRFSDLGAPQQIVAPSNARPLSELLADLQRSGVAAGAGVEG
jgi:hypothetical protein